MMRSQKHHMISRHLQKQATQELTLTEGTDQLVINHVFMLRYWVFLFVCYVLSSVSLFLSLFCTYQQQVSPRMFSKYSLQYSIVYKEKSLAVGYNETVYLVLSLKHLCFIFYAKLTCLFKARFFKKMYTENFVAMKRIDFSFLS